MKKAIFHIEGLKINSSIINFISYNKLIVFMSFLLITGLALGVSSVDIVHADIVKKLDFLFCSDFDDRLNQSYMWDFISSFSSLSIFLILMICATLSFFGVLLIPLMVLFRGLGLGLMAGYLCLIHGFKGVVFYILMLIPGILISSIGFISLAKESFVFSLKFASKLFPYKESERLSSGFVLYLKNVGYVIILFITSSCVDTLLMMLFSKFFNF